MPFILVKQGQHPSDRMFACHDGQAFRWTGAADDAIRFDERESAENLIIREPAGPLYEGGVSFLFEEVAA